MTLPVPIPQPSYSQARENLVKAIPHKIICLLACGGRDCRYEGPACWRPSQQVIQGLFSSWVTDDIVAMTRPSTHLINKYHIIEQFKRLNIKSIINMQLPGEHGYCGPPLDPDSGFTYSPQTFMENDIFFFNFGMPDFSVSSLVGMMDGVKVLAFAVTEGKVAVHCHAGLGRTGVLIACYLVYTLRISPSEAVQYVRIKRPRSIQTRAQINLVFDFARLLGTQLAQYPDLSLRHGAHFTLQLYLHRQALLLHGPEARTLRHLPKVVYLLCLRLSCLALGLPAQAEVHAELERKAEVRALGWAVRETLVAKQYLPLLREVQRASWLGSRLTSVSSWDEPLGFLERKREVLLDKRSYSDSDLSKIAVRQDLELGSYYEPLSGTGRVWYGLDQIKPDLRPVSPDPATPSVGHCDNTEHSQRPHPPAGSGANNNDQAKKSKCAAKKTKALPKFSSNIELRRTQRKSGQASVARAVAKAMADQNTPRETVLQRAALIQEELNTSECGWALLVTESDPQVLSCLLWAWLEKLKDPVLSADDISLLSSGAPCTNLHVLLKPQQHTISCLLGCVGQVTSLCPHREDAVLRRLMRALVRRSQEELESHTALMKILKCNIRETLHCKNFLTHACNNTVPSASTVKKK